MRHHHHLRAPWLLALLAFAGPAKAAETITYTYDARGRVTAVARSGNVNNGAVVAYGFDKADNRLGLGAGSGLLLSIAPASAVEGTGIVFTVTKHGTTTSTVTVAYVTSAGTASSADYGYLSGTLTFTASETSKTVSVSTANDTTHENSEDFYLNLSSPTGGAAIAKAKAVGTIHDND